MFLTDDRSSTQIGGDEELLRQPPGVRRLFDAESRRLGPLIEKRRAVIDARPHRSLLHIATAAAANYQREKAERGLLDYDDLIDKTLAMLDRGASGWVHYKLDRGVDHVLIDEAQDTSPRQWDIVAHIISEFTSGAGARDGVVRTVFAVGDEKQSIFSFQGADPHQFAERRRRTEEEIRRRRAEIRSGLLHLFVPLGTGDPAVGRSCVPRRSDLSQHPCGKRLSRTFLAGRRRPQHDRSLGSGRADEKQDIEGWRAPFDGVSVTSPEVKLVKAHSGRDQGAGHRRHHDGTCRQPPSARYGDVLVLVRRRGNVFDAVIQALKHAGIPVAGADRLKLTEHIAIIDLMNLADALLLPQDDLALAVALKSPLFGLDDDDLFKLARDRKGSLREALNRPCRER